MDLIFQYMWRNFHRLGYTVHFLQKTDPLDMNVDFTMISFTYMQIISIPSSRNLEKWLWIDVVNENSLVIVLISVTLAMISCTFSTNYIFFRVLFGSLNTAINIGKVVETIRKVINFLARHVSFFFFYTTWFFFLSFLYKWGLGRRAVLIMALPYIFFRKHLLSWVVISSLESLKRPRLCPNRYGFSRLSFHTSIFNDIPSYHSSFFFSFIFEKTVNSFLP